MADRAPVIETLGVKLIPAQYVVTEAPDLIEISLDMVMSGSPGLQLIAGAFWIGKPDAVRYEIESFDVERLVFVCRKEQDPGDAEA